MINRNSPYIFVYGTLKNGFRIKESIVFKNTARFYSKGTCRGVLYTTGAYPALKHTHARFRIKGEIFLLKSLTNSLRLLDQYEKSYGSDKEYVRTIIPVQSPNSITIMCHVYIYNKGTSNLTRLKKGEYFASSKKKYSLGMQPF